ncbi:1-deoxy-D-xylulose-5-phosphate synthase N-terminal domain-containing protein [Streptomyces sp. RGM 3693]|uniref:1-deoxy-D-xylulose-5-phosphate synthase N-terminal domain-containing protein n=1 Tax=Streptomyces sp. RGM 3693 TaxID=3413284 RepID=UPI003D2E834D
MPPWPGRAGLSGGEGRCGRGRLGPHLRVVELASAPHRVLDCPQGAIVFAVGQQRYVRKLLTGASGLPHPGLPRTAGAEAGDRLLGWPRSSPVRHPLTLGRQVRTLNSDER